MTSPLTRRAAFCCGVWFLAHVLSSVAIRIAQGRGYEAFWLSHVAELVGAIGLLCNLRSWTSTALCSVLGIHLVWVVDALFGLLGLPRPLGVTDFLERGGALEWWVQHTHFLLFGVLLLDVVRHGALEPRAWLWASLLFALLVALSRIALPASGNVNMAWYPGEGLDFRPLVELAARRQDLYLALVVDAVVLVLIVPTQWLIETWLAQASERTRFAPHSAAARS